MESLPLEMVEKIAEQLTPQDLAHCSAVCRKWHDIFNQDCLWKMHCVAELEETLRTTPCVATTKFVSPEDENSTLPPICQWKLAFLRENHLWLNWGRVENLRYIHDKNMLNDADGEVFSNKNILHINFLTDSQVVIWYKTHIKIMDVSVKPAVCIAKSDPVYISDRYNYSVFGTTGLRLLIEKDNSVDVYNVDLPNKLIKLNRRILFKDPVNPFRFCLVKENFYFILNARRSVFQVFDLNTGELLKEDPWPAGLDEADNNWNIQSSLTSDFITINFQVGDFNKLYIYNIKQLTSFPSFEVEMKIEAIDYYNIDYRLLVIDYLQIAMHQNWLAYAWMCELTVRNMQTGEVVFRHQDDFVIDGLNLCDGRFIFPSGSLMKSYSPIPQTLTIVGEEDTIFTCIERVIHNKVVAGFVEQDPCVWVFTGRKVKKYRMSNDFAVCQVNSSFTKILVVIFEYRYRYRTISYYVQSLW